MTENDDFDFINALTTQMEKDLQEMEPEPSIKLNDSANISTPIQSTVKNVPKDDRIYEKYSKIYIRNPVISIPVIESMYCEKEVFTIQSFKNPTTLLKLSSNSLGKISIIVTGVLCSKAMNNSYTGKPYSRWDVSSLQSGFENYLISLFLFGSSHENFWKTDIGTLISIINPKLLENKVPSSKIQLSVNAPNSIFIIGQACDFGVCKGMVVKSASKCNLFVNRSNGDYCEYHVTSALKKIANTRLDVQSSYGKPLLNINKNNNDSKIQPFNSYNNNSSNYSNIDSTTNLESYGKPTKSLRDYMNVPTIGSINLLKHNTQKEKEKFENKSNEPCNASVTSFLNKNSSVLNSTLTKRLWSESNVKDILSQRNKCGSFEIIYEDKLAESKAKAIEIIQKSGGLKKRDPNIFKSNILFNKATISNLNNFITPAIQKSKISAEEKDKIKNAKSLLSSPHDEELLNQYFDKKIFKENIEDKARSITELNVSLFCCKTCNYKSEHLLPKCSENKHIIIKIKAKKRFFECKICKTNISVVTNIPTLPCKKCGQLSYERTSMFRESKGPDVGGEGLYITDPTKKI